MNSLWGGKMLERGLLCLIAVLGHAATALDASAQGPQQRDLSAYVSLVRAVMNITRVEMGRARPALLDSVTFAKAIPAFRPRDIAISHDSLTLVGVRNDAIICSAANRECTVRGDRVFIELHRLALRGDSLIADLGISWIDQHKVGGGASRQEVTRAGARIRLARRGSAWEVVDARFLWMT